MKNIIIIGVVALVIYVIWRSSKKPVLETPPQQPQVPQEAAPTNGFSIPDLAGLFSGNKNNSVAEPIVTDCSAYTPEEREQLLSSGMYICK